MTEKLAPIVGYDPTLEELGIDGHLAQMLQAEGLESDSQIEQYGDVQAIDGIGAVLAAEVYAARKAWRERSTNESADQTGDEPAEQEPADQTGDEPAEQEPADQTAQQPVGPVEQLSRTQPAVEPDAELLAAPFIQHVLVKLRKPARVGNHQGDAGEVLALVELMPDVTLNFLVDAVRHELAGEEAIETA